jgi:hypothetical protein
MQFIKIFFVCSVCLCIFGEHQGFPENDWVVWFIVLSGDGSDSEVAFCELKISSNCLAYNIFLYTFGDFWSSHAKAHKAL